MMGAWATVFLGIGVAVLVIAVLISFEDWFNDKTKGV